MGCARCAWLGGRSTCVDKKHSESSSDKPILVFKGTATCGWFPIGKPKGTHDKQVALLIEHACHLKDSRLERLQGTHISNLEWNTFPPANIAPDKESVP